MTDHPVSIRSDRCSAKTSAVMSAEEIDCALSAMARASEVLLQESDAAERRRDELDDLNEALIEQQAKGWGSVSDPESVLLSVRLGLATDSATRHREAAREFVSWWADAATVAWEAAVLETAVPFGRLVGAAPGILLADDELAVLPKVDEHTRRLVELGAFLGSPSHLRSSDGDDEDPAAMAADLAVRSGLRIRLDDAGEVEVVEGDDPEARRCRLWGDFWVEHRIPAFPEPDDLEKWLSRAPSETEAHLRAAVKAVVQAVVAGSRIDEIESKDEAWTPEEIDEYDGFMELWGSLTTLLADYAQAVTDSLPALRGSNRGKEQLDKTK